MNMVIGKVLCTAGRKVERGVDEGGRKNNSHVHLPLSKFVEPRPGKSCFTLWQTK